MDIYMCHSIELSNNYISALSLKYGNCFSHNVNSVRFSSISRHFIYMIHIQIIN